jgi:hypothetical protein
MSWTVGGVDVPIAMNIRYRVTLTAAEREQLEALVKGGKGPVRRIKGAQIRLAADAKSTDEAIAINVGAGTSNVYRTATLSR